MLLGEIRNYVQQRGTTSLHDVATHFDITEDNALFALNYWQKQGKIRAQAAACGSGCGSKNCSTAKSDTPTIFEWIRREIPLQFHMPRKM